MTNNITAGLVAVFAFCVIASSAAVIGTNLNNQAKEVPVFPAQVEQSTYPALGYSDLYVSEDGYMAVEYIEFPPMHINIMPGLNN